jgi:hypothetical protein
VTAMSERLGTFDDALVYDDVPTPPMSPKPLFVSNESDKSMSRQERIAMLLAKAAPRPDGSEPTTTTTSLSGSGRSLTLPRASSYSAPKGSILAPEPAPVTPVITATSSPPASPRPEPTGRKIERAASFSAQKSPRSTTLTLITTAVASLSPRGEKLRSRSNSFSGTAIDQQGRGTFTRIIYFPSPIAVLIKPNVYLVPNNVVTEGMRAALRQAHDCEFGIGTDQTGDNESDLKFMATQLLEVDAGGRHRVTSQKKAKPAGDRGMLLQYLQTGSPESHIAKTTITHEYIFKKAM